MDRVWRYTYGEYLRELCMAMGLRDWEIVTTEEPAPDNAHADVLVARGQRTARIRFGLSFEKRPRDENRLTCCHELLHIHTWGIRDAFEEAQKVNKKNALALLRNQCDLADEYAVSAIAAIIAPFMPLPPEVPLTAEEIERRTEGISHGEGQDAAAVSSAHPGHEDEAGRGSAGERGETPDGQRAEEGPEAPDEKEVEPSYAKRLYIGFQDWLLSQPAV